MLWYLHMCSVNKLTVLEYRYAAPGVMEEHEDGSGEFVSASLRPTVVGAGDDQAKALALHNEAHRRCFIARSVTFPVDIVQEMREGTTPEKSATRKLSKTAF
jgi:organic hydroperoxide reductase OsmC/OhrA